MSDKNTRPCGNPSCSCATGIHEGITFGWGNLDEFGYFKYPCHICARDFDSKRDQRIAILKEKYKTEPDVNKYLAEHYDWLFIEAWPFKE